MAPPPSTPACRLARLTGPRDAARMDEQKRIGIVGAAFLGLGAMVGAGIFALLGQAGAVVGSAVWLSSPARPAGCSPSPA
jgi:hypothetical protein